jgi:hypothetical protein
MQTLETIAKHPSVFDSEQNYMGAPLSEFSGLYVVMTRNRESSFLTEHNWNEALDLLGGESDSVVIHRFGHWACGWWEALCVTESNKQAGQAIVDQLDCYPILNEDQFSEKEYEKSQEYWAELTIKERVELCQQADVCIFAARHNWIPQDDDSGYIFEHCRPE